jgi:hypothetical protein
MNTVLNTCITRGYLKRTTLAADYNRIIMTDLGQGRAISVCNASTKQSSPASISIGTLNANAPTQIGNQNTQHIEMVFKDLISRIESSDASEEEKKEAKNRLKSFLEHPLVNTVIGSASSILGGLLLG